MPKARFEVPDDLTKELSKATVAIYKAALNKLATAGYEDREALLKEDVKVIKEIGELTGEGDDDAARHKRRVFLSAIFWILEHESLDAKRRYYDAFQTSKQNYVAPKQVVMAVPQKP